MIKCFNYEMMGIELDHQYGSQRHDLRAIQNIDGISIRVLERPPEMVGSEHFDKDAPVAHTASTCTIIPRT
jgi:hypothetical protein